MPVYLYAEYTQHYGVVNPEFRHDGVLRGHKMKNLLILVALLLGVLALWYYSIVLSPDIAQPPVLKDLLSGINSWFSIVALVAALFALSLVVLNLQTSQNQFDRLMKQNSLNMEIIALSSLIQEADSTLHRYDRWEAAGIKGDYVNAKSSVREKMNAQREQLERKYEEISGLV